MTRKLRAGSISIGVVGLFMEENLSEQILVVRKEVRQGVIDMESGMHTPAGLELTWTDVTGIVLDLAC